ncbi:ER membrane protein complex subunit 2 [Willisornis vidua]|uniref:ER membrane protein complex subunit 2 n=1 Tax=Willisornis vidua TaxID=1566151 RepID=A0ABQ9DCW1_9PASS|nr:ER membrane protein complex subunit 2 [Willisornis vidua]
MNKDEEVDLVVTLSSGRLQRPGVGCSSLLLLDLANSCRDMRDKMRKWREENYRNSEQIVDVGEELINEYASKLGDDIWIIYEQVMIAALDCSRDDLALFCLQELRRQFPGSHRVKRLTGMRFEAMERYDDAIQLYDRILQEDSTNTAARKRKIAIRKAQGKNLEAIRELNEYLEQFVGDQEAWHELAELYINEHDYAKAAFCLEELMMTNPHNHLYCQQYAESASHIASNPKASAKMKKDNMKYASWAANQINRAYQDENSLSHVFSMPNCCVQSSECLHNMNSAFQTNSSDFPVQKGSMIQGFPFSSRQHTYKYFVQNELLGPIPEYYLGNKIRDGIIQVIGSQLALLAPF